mmetsp:Transcript_10088/g.21907  ORF Transcript_10088/g.21907 Transcript_10088/m.21907 type:complete len:329 (+) Transcript_10088:130-1116(+)
MQDQDSVNGCPTWCIPSTCMYARCAGCKGILSCPQQGGDIQRQNQLPALPEAPFLRHPVFPSPSPPNPCDCEKDTHTQPPQRCFFDTTCPGRGCGALGKASCRFCGFTPPDTGLAYPPCPQLPQPSPPPLAPSPSSMLAPPNATGPFLSPDSQSNDQRQISLSGYGDVSGGTLTLQPPLADESSYTGRAIVAIGIFLFVIGGKLAYEWRRRRRGGHRLSTNEMPQISAVSLEVLPEGTSRTEKAAEEPERRDVGVEKLSDKIRMVASGSQDPGGTVAKASKRKTSKEASEQPTERQPRQKDRLLSPQQVQHKKKSRRDLASLKMGTEL